MQPVLSATSLIGDKVVGGDGEDLGKLEDIMIDMASGKLEYGVLSFGGFLKMGGKLFAIPFERFSVDAARKVLVLNLERERLENAPGFDKNDWPNFANEAFRAEISSYYGERG